MISTSFEAIGSPKTIFNVRLLPRIALRGHFDEDQSVNALLAAT
jgi:hypothetical protein